MNKAQALYLAICCRHPACWPTIGIKKQHAEAAALAEELTQAFKDHPELYKLHPEGDWRADVSQVCFCARAPIGHCLGIAGCRFQDGVDKGWLCPDCREPARVRAHYSENPHDEYPGQWERWCEVTTDCCHAQPYLPNGTRWDKARYTPEDFESAE